MKSTNQWASRMHKNILSFFSVSLFNMNRQLRKLSTLRANKQQKDKKFKMIIINIVRHLREEFAVMKQKEN